MNEPRIKAGKFYINATVVCPCCDNEDEVMIGLDKVVYHECNKGNVRTIVPSLKDFLDGKF